MDIQSLIERDGITLKREAGTNGGELAGPCPFCGGRDRFRVWPEKGRYWCRQCRAGGDAIQYLRDRQGMSYREACAALGCETPFPARHETTAPPKPPADEWLSVPWQESAWGFLEETRISLQWNEPEKSRLHARGLNDETISALGWNSRTERVDRETWGLPAGSGKRLWLPKGVVIPTFDGKFIHRLRIRLAADEFERSKEWTNGKGIKYAEIPGSGPDPLLLPGRDGAGAWAVVESELDALLVHQEAGDLVSVIGLGSAQARPPARMLKAMSGERVLVCLDHDAAGRKEAFGFWSTYGEYWPVPDGKDPGEYHQAGGDIRSWIAPGVEPGALQEAREPVYNGDIEAIKASEGHSLPCKNPKIRCFHLRRGHCFYKSNWGPTADLDQCPMVCGLGHGEAHPDLEALYRQRAMITCKRRAHR